MSDSAKRRVQALGKQLAPPSTPGSEATFDGIPLIKKVAPDSNGPRVAGKVVIITGKYLELLPIICLSRRIKG